MFSLAGDSSSTQTTTSHFPMADLVENSDQNALIPDGEHCPESEDGCQQPESPGMQKLQHLATTRLGNDEPEMPAKLVQRPISSGSTELREYSYGAAPKRDMHIAKKKSTMALYGALGSGLHNNTDGGRPITSNTEATRDSARRRLEAQSLHASTPANNTIAAHQLKD
jgi:hypothetical protein